MAVLEATGITKIFGGDGFSNTTKALNGIDFKMDKGEFVGIMGPSGSGKTTLLNVLSGLMPPTSGKVNINNIPVQKMSRDDLALFRRKNLGFIFQDFNLLDSLTVRENIILPMVLDKKDITEMDNRAEELMKLLDLYEARNKHPYQISGGQVQRTCIARALVNRPSLLFADEPTGNLDSNTSKAIMTYLEKINTERHHSILLVTHDPFSASFCSRIVFIKDGAISMEIHKKRDRKDFFDRILEGLALQGGVKHDLP